MDWGKIGAWAAAPGLMATGAQTKGIGKYLVRPITDEVLGKYGTSDFGKIQEMRDVWANVRRADLEKNSMENLVGERFAKLADEATQAAESSTQSGIDRALQYGATGGELERAKRAGSLNRLNMWAEVEKQKADALIGAKQQDIAAKRAFEDNLFGSSMDIEQARLASRARQGGWFS